MRAQLISVLFDSPGGCLEYPRGIALALGMTMLSDEVRESINALIRGQIAVLEMWHGVDGPVMLRLLIGPPVCLQHPQG